MNCHNCVLSKVCSLLFLRDVFSPKCCDTIATFFVILKLSNDTKNLELYHRQDF